MNQAERGPVSAGLFRSRHDKLYATAIDVHVIEFAADTPDRGPRGFRQFKLAPHAAAR